MGFVDVEHLSNTCRTQDAWVWTEHFLYGRGLIVWWLRCDELCAGRNRRDRDTGERVGRLGTPTSPVSRTRTGTLSPVPSHSRRGP